jgi:methylated-DNA-[protein]-cysteine S-methyltransferase
LIRLSDHRFMPRPQFALFETPVGSCALVWGASGLVAVLLPEASASETRARAQRRFGDAFEAETPADIRQVMTRVVALLSGQPDSLQDIELDISAVPPFNLRLLEIEGAPLGAGPGLFDSA